MSALILYGVGVLLEDLTKDDGLGQFLQVVAIVVGFIYALLALWAIVGDR